MIVVNLFRIFVNFIPIDYFLIILTTKKVAIINTNNVFYHYL